MQHLCPQSQLFCHPIKNYETHKKGKTNSLSRDKATEPNTEMTLMLELSDRDARITMINMLKDPEEKISM